MNQIVFLLLAAVALSTVYVSMMDSHTGPVSPLEGNYDSELVNKWLTFQKSYNKFYASAEEEKYRFSVFLENYERAINMTTPEVQFGITEFSDLSSTEFADLYLGFKHNTAPKRRGSRDHSVRQMNNTRTIKKVSLPAFVNWEATGNVTAVQNQAACGSCWAFSAVGAIESAFSITNHIVPPVLSEEQLVQCASVAPYNNEGCNGGWMNTSFLYAEKHPLTTAELYPYTSGGGKTGICQTVLESQGNYTVVDYDDVPEGDCLALGEAVANTPVSVAVDANIWQIYIGGTIPHGICGHKLDHGVLLVGYTETYWIIKNSWGAGWGIKGYIHLAKDSFNEPNQNSNTCGLCNAASYPKVPFI